MVLKNLISCWMHIQIGKMGLFSKEFWGWWLKVLCEMGAQVWLQNGIESVSYNVDVRGKVNK